LSFNSASWEWRGAKIAHESKLSSRAADSGKKPWLALSGIFAGGTFTTEKKLAREMKTRAARKPGLLAFDSLAGMLSQSAED